MSFGFYLLFLKSAGLISGTDVFDLNAEYAFFVSLGTAVVSLGLGVSGTARMVGVQRRLLRSTSARSQRTRSR